MEQSYLLSVSYDIIIYITNLFIRRLISNHVYNVYGKIVINYNAKKFVV